MGLNGMVMLCMVTRAEAWIRLEEYRSISWLVEYVPRCWIYTDVACSGEYRDQQIVQILNEDSVYPFVYSWLPCVLSLLFCELLSSPAPSSVIMGRVELSFSRDWCRG